MLALLAVLSVSLLIDRSRSRHMPRSRSAGAATGTDLSRSDLANVNKVVDVSRSHPANASEDREAAARAATSKEDVMQVRGQDSIVAVTSCIAKVLSHDDFV